MGFPTHNGNLPPLTPIYSLDGPGPLYVLFSLISNPIAPAYPTNSPLTSTFIKQCTMVYEVTKTSMEQVARLCSHNHHNGVRQIKKWLGTIC